jgi:putative ABC transport system ATP-binding protein
MVTHDPELARRPPRNVQVLDGRIQDEAAALGSVSGGPLAVDLAAAPA